MERNRRGKRVLIRMQFSCILNCQITELINKNVEKVKFRKVSHHLWTPWDCQELRFDDTSWCHILLARVPGAFLMPGYVPGM